MNKNKIREILTITANYWWEVLRLSTKKALQVIDLRENVIGGVFRLVLLIITSGLVARGMIDKNIPTDVSTDFRITILVFGTAILAALLVLLLNLIYTPAYLHNGLRILADKFTWNGIEIEIVPFPDDYVVSYGIKVTNKKPFIVENVIIKIKEQEVGAVDRTVRHLYPAPLAWLSDRKFFWGEVSIAPQSGEQTAALFLTNPRDARLLGLQIPGPDGQPGDRKSMGGTYSDEGVLYADFVITCNIDDHNMNKPIRVRGEIIDQDTKVTII